MKQPIEIYLEQTPNPECLKFVTNQIILPEMSIECKRGDNTEEFPLAESLFEKFPWITIVFGANNFISVTKNVPEDWYELMQEVREFIKMYLQNNLQVVSQEYISSQSRDQNINLEPETTEGKIINLLDKYVRPAVERDGGNIIFKSYDEGKVTLKMQGSCSGCPSSQVTLKNGIEGLLKRMVPEVMEVVAEEE